MILLYLLSFPSHAVLDVENWHPPAAGAEHPMQLDFTPCAGVAAMAVRAKRPVAALSMSLAKLHLYFKMKTIFNFFQVKSVNTAETAATI